MTDHIIPDAGLFTGWRKSSYSGNDAGNCLEVLDDWRKSSYSGNDAGECLEVRDNDPRGIPVRDSKAPHGPAIVFSSSSWTTFISAVRTARLD